MEEQSYTCTHPLGHTGPLMGSLYLYLYLYLNQNCGPGSSVGIATDYGLDGPGSNLPYTMGGTEMEYYGY